MRSAVEIKETSARQDPASVFPYVLYVMKEARINLIR